MTSEGVGIVGGEDDAGPAGELEGPAGGLEAGGDEAEGEDSGKLDATEDEAGGVDPGGAGMDDEVIRVPVWGRVLWVAGGPLGGDETGQIVVEIAIVEVTTIVE